MTARILQINTSKGGVPKLARREAHVGTLGLEGDAHKHLTIHGGPERAVCLWSLEVIQALQAEGHPIFPGSAGENITISGLDWTRLAAGTRIALGDAVTIVLTRPTEPCKVIAGSFSDGKSTRIDHDTHPGFSRWYARVEREGVIRVGQVVELR